MTDDKPPVESCTVDDCEFWGDGNMCHAESIWVGSEHATCDTYERSDHHECLSGQADVRQCDVDSCTFNSSTMCNAPSINVAWHTGHADCATCKMS